MKSSRDEIRELIEKMAQLVREKLSIVGPIKDMRTIVEKLHGECVEQANFDYDAKIVVLEFPKFEIEYNTAQSFERRNFSIAHELGHLFIHLLEPNGQFIENQPYYRGKYGSLPNAEWEADEFAAAFLMPKNEFIDYFYEQLRSSDIVNVATIAEHFCVSKQAASVRGRVLGLW